MIKAVFYDLDGTLLPMKMEEFLHSYLSLICSKVEHLGYDKKKLVDTIMRGTYLMTNNDGSKTNYEVFWEYFSSVFGKEREKDIPIFNEFYANEFKETISATQPTPLSKQIVDFTKKNFKYTILATNPYFPLVGVETRLKFIDLKLNDFDFVTSYENSNYCKPNPKYFLWLLDKFSLKPEEVIMIGNDDNDDASSSTVGIKCYLLKNTIIHNKNSQYQYEEINMDEVIPTLSKYL